MIRTDKRQRVCGVLLIAVLVFIWGNSLLPAQISGAISDWLKALLTGQADLPPVPEGEVDILRKFAHLTEFAALGWLLGWHFAMRGMKPRRALFRGAVVACVDETIQAFVPGRGPGLWDVGIDICGVLAGILLLHLGHLLWRNHLTRKYGGN